MWRITFETEVGERITGLVEGRDFGEACNWIQTHYNVAHIVFVDFVVISSLSERQ